MPFCTQCGNPVSETASFCTKCGNALRRPTFVAAAPSFEINYVEGTENDFPLAGETITISAAMDTFNNYRKQFAQAAAVMAGNLRDEYCARINDLDSFLTVFPEIYAKHRKPLIDAAMRVLAQADLFDVSPEQFEDQHRRISACAAKM